MEEGTFGEREEENQGRTVPWKPDSVMEGLKQKRVIDSKYQRQLRSQGL